MRKHTTVDEVTTWQLEPWNTFYPEAAPIMLQHWEEIAIDKDKIKFGINNDSYQQMQDRGVLHILTCRVDDILAGYFIAFILPHVHYCDSGLFAFTDVYYMLPKYRKGGRGMEMFAKAEESLRLKKVVKIYLSTKVKHDNSPLFERLGFKISDKVFTKLI